jgi:ribosome-binding ATPase YchF (GTP1/OBG family)
VCAHLNAGKPARSLELTDDERKEVATWGLMTAKPVLYCCNVGEGDLPNGNAWSDLVKARAPPKGAGVVILCGKIEAELAEPTRRRPSSWARTASPSRRWRPRARVLPPARPAVVLHRRREGDPRLDDPQGGQGPEAAGVIHTDFEKGFIRAQVYSLADLELHGSEAALKAASDRELLVGAIARQRVELSAPS